MERTEMRDVARGAISVPLVSVLVCLGITGGQVRYYDIRLPSYPPRGAVEAPASINDSLDICGPNFNTDTVRAYVWRDGAKQVLPFRLGVPPAGYAHDINNHGVVIGGAVGVNASGQLWNGRDVIDLGTLGGDYSVPYAINDANQVVGRSRTGIGNEARPFLWDNGTMTDLGTLGGTFGEALAVNRHGVVVGYSRNTAGQNRAFVWRPGMGMVDLGTLGGTASMAFAINDANDIVGFAEIDNGYQHACIWQDGQIHDLGTLGGSQSQAFAINNAGQIIGWAETATGYRPLVVWVGGRIVRLQQLVEPDSGWELMIPAGEDRFPWFHITDGGAILGRGFVNGYIYPFLMMPTDRPFLLSDANDDQQVDMADLAVMAAEWLR